MLSEFPYNDQCDMPPGRGVTLIANPFLKDPNFSRSVIYLCDHSEEGSFGFIVNRPSRQSLNEVMPDTFNKPLKLYLGGPVQLDTVHFLHQYPDRIDGGLRIKQGIYWGGNFEQAIALINAGEVEEEKIKFFLGYAGWGAGQLKNEVKEDSWIVSESRKQLVFKVNHTDEVWAKYLKSMGEGFALMANYPIDPSLN